MCFSHMLISFYHVDEFLILFHQMFNIDVEALCYQIVSQITQCLILMLKHCVICETICLAIFGNFAVCVVFN